MIKSWQIVIYNWEYRMVYGVYWKNNVSLCFNDYLDTECDYTVSVKDIEVLDNNDFFIVETNNRVLYITAWDVESALETVDLMLVVDEKLESCKHWSVFIALK